jgi:hypothetical protein
MFAMGCAVSFPNDMTFLAFLVQSLGWLGLWRRHRDKRSKLYLIFLRHGVF